MVQLHHSSMRDDPFLCDVYDFEQDEAAKAVGTSSASQAPRSKRETDWMGDAGPSSEPQYHDQAYVHLNDSGCAGSSSLPFIQGARPSTTPQAPMQWQYSQPAHYQHQPQYTQPHIMHSSIPQTEVFQVLNPDNTVSHLIHQRPDGTSHPVEQTADGGFQYLTGPPEISSPSPTQHRSAARAPPYPGHHPPSSSGRRQHQHHAHSSPSGGHKSRYPPSPPATHHRSRHEPRASTSTSRRPLREEDLAALEQEEEDEAMYDQEVDWDAVFRQERAQAHDDDRKRRNSRPEGSGRHARPDVRGSTGRPGNDSSLQSENERLRRQLAALQNSGSMQQPETDTRMQRPVPQAAMTKERQAEEDAAMIAPGPDGGRTHELASSDGINLRNTRVLGDMFKGLFKYELFNKMQSKALPVIYQCEDNVVITAPTGAGKTAIFEIGMVRVLQDQNGKESKIVYIAPTKSLCSERVADWKAKFRTILDHQPNQEPVVELTGDTSDVAYKVCQHARIIVTTPEKWDVVTRKKKTINSWFRKVKLFCIDEVHLLAEERGAVLEVIVSRMKNMREDIRFIAVSATVPNIDDVGEWIGYGRPLPSPAGVVTGEDAIAPRNTAHVFKFGDAFRSCPLSKIVYAYPTNGKSDHQFESSLNFKLLDLILKHASSKPVLVFCNTRKGCLNAATQLQKDYEAANKKNVAPPWPKPAGLKGTLQDPVLQALAVMGIGVHSGGVGLQDRRLIESLFIEGKIRVICTTSTLAVGVNLPARMVIIKNTKMWDANLGKMVDYSDLDILQMQGRAGRPSFDTMGVSVIMCSEADKAKYEALSKSLTTLESSLHQSLVEHVNAEIAIGTITDKATAKKWLHNSFLRIRLNKNPRFYRSAAVSADGDGTMDAILDASPSERLEQLVGIALQGLEREQIIEEYDGKYTATNLGVALAGAAVRFPTFIKLKESKTNASMQDVLHTVSQADEFKDLRFRSGEKQLYANDVNKRDEIRFPLERVEEPCDKVNLLMQWALVTENNFVMKLSGGANPGGEAALVMQYAARIAYCLADLADIRRDGPTLLNALELWRSLKGRTWNHRPGVLMQLDGIGANFAKTLWDHHVQTFEDMRNAATGNLEAMGVRKGSATQAQKMACMLPEPFVEARIVQESVRDDGVRVTIEITAGLKNRGEVQLTIKTRKIRFSAVTTTSDGLYIELNKLNAGDLFKADQMRTIIRLNATLTKPSQKIEVLMACDEIVGLEASAIAVPSTPARHYPLPTARLTTVSEEDEEGHLADRTAFRPSTSKQPMTMTKKDGPEKMPNGRYRCLHTCKDRYKCKHDCCREGLLRAPKRRNSSATSKASSNAVSDPEQVSKTGKGKAKTTGRKSAASAAFGAAAEADYGITDPLLAAFVRENYRPSASTSALLPASAKKRTSAVLDDDDDDMLPDISQAYAFTSISKKPITTTKPPSKPPAKRTLPKKRRITDKSSDDDADLPPAQKRQPKQKPAPRQGSPPPRPSAKKAPRQISQFTSSKQADTHRRTDMPSPFRAHIVRPAPGSEDERDELSGEDSPMQLPPPLRGPALASPKRQSPIYLPKRGSPPSPARRRSNQPPLFRPLSTSTSTLGDLDEKDQLMKEVEDLTTDYESNEEDKRPESKYGSENEASPAGSQAHEVNEPSDDGGKSEAEDFTDSIAL